MPRFGAQSIIAVVAIGGVIAFLFLGHSPDCVGYQILELPSPTKAFLAKVENNTCTPSHDPQTVVEVTGGPGVTSWAFEGSAKSSKAAPSTIPVTLSWLGNAELQIAYPHGTDVRSHWESIGNVKVVYKEVEAHP
jgi:hypothetical protein